MPTLTDAELLILLKRGVQKLPASLLRDLKGSAEAREMALRAATKILFDHFREAGHQVVRPEREDRLMADTQRH